MNKAVNVNWEAAKQAILDALNEYPKGNTKLPPLTIYGASASQLAITTGLPIEITDEAARRLVREDKIKDGFIHPHEGPKFKAYFPKGVR